MSLKYTKITTWQENEPPLRAIRQAVFVIGQQCPPEAEWDGQDAGAIHFLVKDSEDKVYASARLVRHQTSANKASIGRFAVYPDYRGQGLGRKLVRYVINFARSQGILELELSAQCHVQGLYAGFGFQAEGDIYEEVGIPHIRMKLILGENNPQSVRVSGEDRRVYRFNDHQNYLSHLLSLLGQARRNILILSHDLEKNTLDHPQVLESLSALARKSRATNIKILIQDAKSPIAESNQLLSLGRRLTSSIAITTLCPELPFPEQVYVIADEQGVLLRHSYQRWEGFCCYTDAGTAQRLSEEFNRLMNHAEPSPELRNFSL